MLSREQIKGKVPFGYGKKIAEKAGVSQKSVSDWLNGKTDSVRIETATLELLAELSKARKKLYMNIA